MATAKPKRPDSAEEAALRLAMARRGWTNKELAAALGMVTGSIENYWTLQWPNKRARVRVNELFGLPIFVEGIGQRDEVAAIATGRDALKRAEGAGSKVAAIFRAEIERTAKERGCDEVTAFHLSMISAWNLFQAVRWDAGEKV